MIDSQYSALEEGAFRMISSIAFAFISLGVFFTPFSALALYWGTIKLADIAFFSGFFLSLIYSFLAQRFFFVPVKLLLSAVITVVGFLIVVTVYENDDIREFPTFMMVVSWFLVPLAIMNQAGKNVRSVKLILAIWMLGILLGAIIGIIQNSGMISIRNTLGLSIHYREAGLTIHPNSFGFYCALGLPLFFEKALLEKSLFNKTLAFIACAILIYSVNISGSRSALVLIGLAILLILIMVALRAGVLLQLVLCLGLMAPLLLAYYSGVIPQLGGDQSAVNRLFFGDPSAYAADLRRTQFFEYVLQVFQEHPFLGNGYRLYGVHDAILGTLALSGVVGLIGFLLREGAAIDDFRHLKKIDNHLRYFGLSTIGLRVSYIVWLTSLLTAYWLLERGGMVVIGLLGAMAVVNLHHRVVDSLASVPSHSISNSLSPNMK